MSYFLGDCSLCDYKTVKVWYFKTSRGYSSVPLIHSR